MSPFDTGRDHVVDRLGPYLTGQLEPDEAVAIEDHMLACARCRDEADVASQIAVGLHSLPPDEVERLRRERPSAEVRPYRPAPNRSGLGRRVLAYAAALVLGAAVGVGTWVWVGPDHPTSTPVSDVVPTAGAGPTVTAVVSPQGPGQSRVEAVIVGLSPGVGFDLIAVGTDDRYLLVVHDTAVGGPQTVSGDVAWSPDDIRFFAVVAQDGHILTAVATVR